MKTVSILTGAAIRDSDQKHYHHMRDYSYSEVQCRTCCVGTWRKIARVPSEHRAIEATGIEDART